MPIQTQNLLSPLSSLHPFKMDIGGDQNLEMDRQRLALMREQFEETKHKNQQDDEYRKLSEEAAMRREQLGLQKQREQEAAAMRREQLGQQRQREQEAAAVTAKNLEARQAAIADFGKLYEARDFGGMAVAAARVNQLGGYARRLDTGGAYPAWQVDIEPPKTPPGLNPMDALGYDTLGTPDTMSETEKGAAPELSTEDAFRQAGSVPTNQAPAAPSGGDPTTDAPDALTGENAQPGAATDQDGTSTAAPAAQPMPASMQGLTPGLTSFAPRRAAEAPDLTGGVTSDVPNDVINTGALQYEQEQRLGPAMAAMAKAYPEGYRSNIEQAGNAMLSAGLSPEKTMGLAQAARQEVGGAVEKEQAHEFKLQEEAAKAGAPLKRTEEQEIVQKGFNRARASFKDKKIQDSIGIFSIADEIEHMLTSGGTIGQDRAINLLGQLDAQSKQQSDADAKRLTGLDRASLADKVSQYLYEITSGGFGDPVKKSMLDFVHDMRERNKTITHDWMESNLRQAGTNREPLVGRGYREFLDSTIPQDLLREYDKEAGDAPEDSSGAQAPAASGGGALEAMAAEHGFNAGAMRRVVGGESGGDPTAASKLSSAKGLWQALDSTAQNYVNPRTGEKFADSKELAQLSPKEQYQVLAQYLGDSGVTNKSPPEDYALAIAAPAFVGKSANEDAVVYPKGSDKWKANKPWRPGDDGDITVGSIVDYYFGNKKQSGGGEKAAKAGKGADNAAALEGL